MKCLNWIGDSMAIFFALSLKMDALSIINAFIYGRQRLETKMNINAFQMTQNGKAKKSAHTKNENH